MVAGLGVLAGCAGSQRGGIPPFPSLGGLAAADSLGLDDFHSLTAAERASRRAEAAAYLERVRVAGSADARAGALLSAAGMAPDNPFTWLDLAELRRWVGEDLAAEVCLERAAEAVRKGGAAGADEQFSRGDLEAAAMRTALQRAWLHYDRAEWREGLRWARAATGYEPGNHESRTIEGLLVAAIGHYSAATEIADDIRRADMFASEPDWILAVLDLARGEEKSAFARLIKSRPGGDEVSDLRPVRGRASECFRDMALIAERIGQWSWARRWYAESGSAVPLDDAAIVQVRHRRLGAPDAAPEMPVWLADDRHYVTGSLSAFAALALERHDAAAAPGRDHWAAAVVNATGILLRRLEDQPWALRARGLVFAARGDGDRALADLQRAATLLAAEGLADARLEAGLGRAHLLRQDHKAALKHLRLAVDRDPRLAAAWSDLGLALVMAVDPEGAAAAFDQAIVLDPTLPAAWYNRGLMHLHAGRYDEAAADLAEAARLAPDNPEIARLLQQLEARRRQPPKP